MFTALPLSKSSAPSTLAPSHNLLASLTTAGLAPNAGNEFSRAMDRAQDRQKPVSLQPPAPPSRSPQPAPSSVKASVPERAEGSTRHAQAPSAQQRAASLSRPPQHNAATKVAQSSAREAQRDSRAQSPSQSPATGSTDSPTQATRRAARARSAAEESPTDSAGAAAAAAAAALPDKTAPLAQGAAAGFGVDKALPGTAGPTAAAAGAQTYGDAGGTATTGGGVAHGGAGRTDVLSVQSGRSAIESPSRIGILANGGLPGSGTINGPISAIGPIGSIGPIGRPSPTAPTDPIDANTVAHADPSMAPGGQVKVDDKIGNADDSQPGAALLDLRITGPVCEYRIAPHLVDKLGAAPPAPATAPAAELAVAATTLNTTPNQPPASNPTTLETTAAGAWRFVQQPQAPNASDAYRPASIAALGSAIGAMNGWALDVRSRQAFSPFDPAPTTPPAVAAAGADNATLTSLAALLGGAEAAARAERAERTGPSLLADTAAAAPGTNAQALLETTATDWQRSAKVHGAIQRQDGSLGDFSARAQSTTADSLLSAAAAQPGTLAESGATGATGTTGLPNFAISLAAQLSSLSAVDGSVNAPPASAEFAAEVSQKIMLLVLDGVQNAKLHLNPAEMGPVTVQIQLDGATAQVHLAAENGDTRQALQDSMPQLASQLRESGLTLTGGGVFEQPRQTPQEPPQDQRSAQPDVKERTRDGAGDTNQAQQQRAGGPARSAAQRGLVDLVA